MAVRIHPESVYAFRRVDAVIKVIGGGSGSATLSTIEQLLIAAGDAYRSRRYLDSIDHYTEARRLIWSQMYPATRFDERAIAQIELFPTLMSYASEWLNVLPLDAGVVGVRPRNANPVAASEVLGIGLETLDATKTNAAADLSSAALLERSGNTTAATFFRNRAATIELANPAAPHVPTPPAAPSPGTPAISGVGELLGPRLNVNIERALSFNRRDIIDLDPVVVPAEAVRAARSYTTTVGGATRSIRWAAGAAPASADIVTTLFESRVALNLMPDVLITPASPADFAASLPHVFEYETTMGLADCHYALGQWAKAEEWLLQAARYKYLNQTVEAPYIWGRLAELYRDWGNHLFRNGEAQDALAVYSKVIMPDGTEPTTELYTHPSLAPGATVARTVMAALANPAGLTASPTIAAPIFDIWAQITKLQGGLDYWGHWAANVPIWTFDYLQSVAVNFCHFAITAERDSMSFWEKADQGKLTQIQLQQNVAQAKAELSAAEEQVGAADAQVVAYAAGEAAAALRAQHARENADEYATKSRQWTMHQALAAQLGAGDDGNASELNRLADKMMSGSYSLSDDRGALVGAEQLAASRLQREYEIDAMRRQQADLQASAAQATAERQAAAARAKAVRASAHAASIRVDGALELAEAFSQQRFSPEVWNKLGERMSALSNRYLTMALDIAKLMQRAYNFENDTERHFVKADYYGDAVQGFLAADSLMADVQSFTYDRITAIAPTPQPVRQTISLARTYPFVFERDFRTTGRMEFTTRIDDFDHQYPGSYAGRVLAVEVDVDGIVPPRGLSGTLTNAGISHYRTPASVWTTGNGLKHRVQNRETLILSDLDRRGDALLVPDDHRRRTIFEGAGVCSSWTIEYPRNVNDLDFNAVTDVRLTFTYEARFDPDLRTRVLADLATRPALHQRQRPIPLRWLFPDAFFHFQATGVLDFTLDPVWFPISETKPQLNHLGLIAVTTPKSRRSGIVLVVDPPGATPTTVTTDVAGIVTEDIIANVAGTPATGEYRITLGAAQNPSWVVGGKLDLDEIDNLAVILDYTFVPRA